jgi:hypothetical protein
MPGQERFRGGGGGAGGGALKLRCGTPSRGQGLFMGGMESFPPLENSRAAHFHAAP